jgi:nitroreductase
VTRLLRRMRAVRRFSEQSIPPEVLADILNVGRWTGSSKNTQPWEVVVVQDRQTLQQLATLGQFAGHLAGAQAAVVLVMDGPNNAFDCGRLAERIMLGAWAYGVGSCIGSIFPAENEERAKALLGIPAEKWVRQTVSLGYPADAVATHIASTPGTRRALPGIGRKPMEQFVSWDRYGQRTPGESR